MHILFEASPSLYTSGDEKAKSELYQKPFETIKFANIKGPKPIKGFGFWESDTAFYDRMQAWKKEDENVLFEGWECTNLGHLQVMKKTENKINYEIVFDYSSYKVIVDSQEFNFPLLPETIDDLITDLRRVGIKLFWKDDVVLKYGESAVTSHRKVVDYYKIIKEME